MKSVITAKRCLTSASSRNEDNAGCGCRGEFLFPNGGVAAEAGKATYRRDARGRIGMKRIETGGAVASRRGELQGGLVEKGFHGG